MQRTVVLILGCPILINNHIDYMLPVSKWSFGSWQKNLFELPKELVSIQEG